ncbi:restriction endonuclease subunit S [Luteococcus japonicus]|nr:restriction endonuclease subunit S [Luteococcus japonicus]
MVTLGEIAKVERTGVDPSTVPDDTWYLGLEHIERGGGIIGRQTAGEAGLASNKFTFTSGHILYGKLRPYLGKIAAPNFSGVCSTDILPVLPSEHIEKRYLLHYLRQPDIIGLANTRSSGANLPRLSAGEFLKFEVPLPPLDEQRRIAAILDQADALRTKRRAQLADLDALPQAIFHAMFGQEVSTVPFGSVVDLIGGKSIVAPDQDIESEYRVIKISAVTSGTFRPHESKALPVGYVPAPHHLIREGDVLMSRANTAELVGAVARVTVPTKNLAVPDKVWRFSWKRPDIDPDYFVAALQQPATRRSMSQLASGSGGSMKNISKSKLEGMPVTWVPHLKQRAFASVTSGIQRIRTSVSQEILATDALFSSLQSRAFRGEL